MVWTLGLERGVPVRNDLPGGREPGRRGDDKFRQRGQVTAALAGGDRT